MPFPPIYSKCREIFIYISLALCPSSSEKIQNLPKDAFLLPFHSAHNTMKISISRGLRNLSIHLHTHTHTHTQIFDTLIYDRDKKQYKLNSNHLTPVVYSVRHF